MKTKQKAVTRPQPAESIRLVYEVYSGNNDEFDGAIVVERTDGAERILYYFQSQGAITSYKDDAQREADRLEMVHHAQAVAADQKNFRLYRSDIIDYRRFGAPASTERMPDDPYSWSLWEPGQYQKGRSRQIFPYCPFRFEEMLMQRCAHFINAKMTMPIGEMDLAGKVTTYPWYEAVYQDMQQGTKDGAK